MKKIFILIIMLLLVFPLNIKADNKEITIHLFYKKDCPHCHELIDYLNTYLEDKDYLKLYKYELVDSKANQELFDQANKILDLKVNSVPFLVIGSESLVGYSKYSTKENINEIISYYQKNKYKDVLGEAFGKTAKTDVEIVKGGYHKTYRLPLIGKIDPKGISLALIAVIIGLVDGFNPCAMWILLFLISMLFNMKDKKKMWILGLSFLATSAIVYALFMLTWLGLSNIVDKVSIIKIVIGLFATGFGVINIYRYFKTKDVGCEVVDTSERKKIIKKIKDIALEKKFIVALLGVILLAVSVNIIEVTCSLGLPVVFIEILNINDLATWKYGLYIFIYILFFLLDDLLIFFIAMRTLKIKAISNKYTKYSHLIGGIIMLLIGLLMIFKYEWLTFTF